MFSTTHLYDDAPPVWLLQSLWTPYDTSTQDFIFVRLSAPSVNTKSMVPRKYWRTRFNLFQSSLVGSDTLVQRKPIAVWISNLHLRDMKSNDATTLWKLSAFSSDTVGLSRMLNRKFPAGVDAFLVILSWKRLILLIIWLFIDNLIFFLWTWCAFQENHFFCHVSETFFQIYIPISRFYHWRP